ncbi:hypothetical protein BDV96DRAFT_595167 [Lophiotrema nucula]|uniref:FAD-binding PCMH-type domain-containing protein n=1 Tax=Lophiotrema nucula TaxID=690887 RepID=A0A6A5ZPD6_9PLEO|nr:hypothetical protein BDV96DRAFT_595167 [Lophiotrema nucula]
MGNTSSTAVQKCLSSAVGGNTALLAYKDTPLYQLSHVKPYNLDIAVTPAAVTYPQTAEHVAAIVKCAADNNLKVQPRCGGHSYANYGIGGADNAIVVDLKNFQQFSIDKSSWQATIGGGTLLRDVTQRLHDNGGRAMAHGTCPQVGIGGHATIGGLGPTSRMWGSALDHVQEVQVVLANSSIIRASDTENKDIFFALKGAGASFGIITEFKVRTEAEPPASVLYSYTIQAGNAAEKANAFKQWQTLIADPTLSRKFASQFILSELGVIVSGTYFGPQAEYDKLNISSRLPDSDDAVIEIKDWLGVVGHWAEDVALEIAGGIQSNFYAKSVAYTKNDLIPDTAVDQLFQYVDKTDKGTPIWFVIWDLEGGAINDVAADATAYGHRDALFYHQSYAVNLVGKVTPTIRSFLTGFNKIITDSLPGHNLGAYAGYVDPALGENGQSAYWGTNLPKLQQVKAAVDPKDIFHNPQSVRPAKANPNTGASSICACWLHIASIVVPRCCGMAIPHFESGSNAAPSGMFDAADSETDGGVRLHSSEPDDAYGTDMSEYGCSSPESEATIVPYTFPHSFSFRDARAEEVGHSHAPLDPAAPEFKPSMITTRKRRSSTVDTWKTAKSHMSPSKHDALPQPTVYQKRLNKMSSLPTITVAGHIHERQGSLSSPATVTTPTTPIIRINGVEPAYTAPEALHFRTASDARLPSTGTGGMRQIIHNRNITDPFIDRNTIPRSPAASTPRTPLRPTIVDFKTFLAERTTTPRIDLPIPPPSLPCASNLIHTPATKQRLDMQKVKRELWIRTQAKQIASLASSKAIAERVWRETGNPSDLAAWGKAIESYNAAIDLEKCMEERRALFMPEGMQPLRTGEGSWLKDGAGGVLAVHGKENGGEGRLLGFNMAIMERICVGVKGRGGDARDEFVDLMSEEDKAAVRRDCVRRVEGMVAELFGHSFLVRTLWCGTRPSDAIGVIHTRQSQPEVSLIRSSSTRSMCIVIWRVKGRSVETG